MKDSITLQWTTDRPDGTDEAVIADIAKCLSKLKSPELLGYHTVFLGDNMETAPGVIVTGEEGNPNFICEYYAAIGDAFETLRPNLDPEDEALLSGLGLADLSGKDLEKVLAALKEKAEINSESAVKVFMRGRGGSKAERSDEDHTLGHEAIANRVAENEQKED